MISVKAVEILACMEEYYVAVSAASSLLISLRLLITSSFERFFSPEDFRDFG